MSMQAIGVIGLGYIGQPMVAAMANVGYRVVGMDIDRDKVAKFLSTYEPTIYEPGLAETLRRCRDRIHFTTSYEEVMVQCKAIFITVGTPVDNDYQPDMRSLDEVLKNLGEFLQSGHIITLRSTVVPGTTIRLARSLEEISGLNAGKDFYVSFCPERTIEGIALYELYNLPNIIGGCNKESAEKTAAVMEKLGNQIIIVSSSTVAELCKLTDNMYRALNISFANEFGKICEVACVDAYEVRQAVNAAYPRTNIFRPGLGADGPCLSKDPLILRHYAQSVGISTPLIDSSVKVNREATHRVNKEIEAFFSKHSLDRPRIALLGLAFKGMPETDDLRGSAACYVHEQLNDSSAKVPDSSMEFCFFDPVVREFNGQKVESSLKDCLLGAHVAIFLSDHPSLRNIPLELVLEQTARPLLVVDVWHNVLRLNRKELPPDVTYVRIGDGQPS